ncbi:MAG: BlaI/MecI/CopY family transcriptional regulator [Acidobacteriota bacterium]
MKKTNEKLSRREREIMDVVYRLGEATASEVQEGLVSPPSYSAVRATLRILVEKGHLVHREDGPRYVFRPTVPAAEASRSALAHLVKTFFGGSPTRAAAALLDNDEPLSEEEAQRLRELLHRRAEELDS